MTRSGQSGGLISLSSFVVLDDSEKQWVNQRLASSSLRLAAAKEGVQSLYADPEDTIKKYKDFDIVQAMSDQNGKFLWVRARAIDADTVNANGDYFSKEELIKEIEYKGEKIPAYKTFEGVPIYTNHKNDDIEEAKGKVVYAEWDEKENCVWVTFFVDEDAYPGIVRGIRQGYMHDVSMGCQVESGTCSVCDHNATTEKEYCKHMEKYKGKSCPDAGGSKAYEKNHGLKFIELSVVGDGAFERCEISEIYDVDELLESALQIEKRVSAIHGDLLIASAVVPENHEDRYAYEDCLRHISAASKTVVRLAQTAGTLVGGQVMAQEGSGTNTTVSGILGYLGLDAASGLNILDMLNLALNFLEVTVMNLFARKDNVDLAHVAKITKSMGDLQSTMQDMIDDGVEAGGGGSAPLNQGALQQQGAQSAPQPPAGQIPQDYSTPGAVGRSMGPVPTQQQAFTPPNAVGGGVMASSRKHLILWDSPDKDKREVYASTKKSGSGNKQSDNLVRLGSNLVDFAQSLGISPSVRVKPNTGDNIQSISKKDNTSGGKNMNDIFEKFKANRLVKNAALVSMDFNVDDNSKDYRVTLSSDGSIKAFFKGARVDWEPDLTLEQMESIANNRGADVAVDLLGQFKKAKAEGRVVKSWEEPDGVFDEVKEKQQEAVWTGTDEKVKELLLDKDADEYGRKGEDNRTREETLESVRKGTPELGEVKEKMLDDDAGLYGRKFVDDDVKEALLKDARSGNPEEVIELQLKARRANPSDNEPTVVVNAAINAMADAVVTAHCSPTEVLKVVAKIASQENLDELLVLASLGTAHRSAFAQKNPENRPSVTAALYNALGQRVSERISASELSRAIVVLSEQGDKIKDHVLKLAHSKKNNTNSRTAKTNLSKEDQLRAVVTSQTSRNETFTKEDLKAAISAFASSQIDTGVDAKEIIASIDSIDEDTLLVEVEMARTASAIEQRQIDRERIEFWGQTRTASKEDVYDNVVGWLADYADAYKVNETSSIVMAAKKIAESADVAVNLTNKMVGYRTAAIEVTDEEVKTKRIVCRVEDLGGIDVKAEDFQNQFRDKAMEIFQNSGYAIDPGTFTMSDVTVSADGNVTASCASRFSKTTKVDTATANPAMASDITETIEPVTEPTVEVPGESGNIAGITPQVYEEGDTVMTAAAKNYRVAKRQEILERYAQMPGGGGMGAMPMGGAGGGITPPPMDPALGANADAGISSLSGGAPGEEGEGVLDETPVPGEKKPWGTVCPQCGSTDVDVANGEGNCQSCGAQLDYTFTVNVKPGNDKEKSETGEEPPAENPFGPDAGLGAATAPAPTAPPAPGGPPAPPGGAGAPPIMAQVKWLADSDTFVRLASPNFNKEKAKTLPVGFICPACGSRDVLKHKNLTYCHACPTISKSSIREASSDPTKVSVSIKWLG